MLEYFAVKVPETKASYVPHSTERRLCSDNRNSFHLSHKSIATQAVSSHPSQPLPHPFHHHIHLPLLHHHQPTHPTKVDRLSVWTYPTR